MRRLTVMFLANDLRVGGAEQLFELARGLDSERFRVLVATTCSSDPYADGLTGIAGVELHSLERRVAWDPMALPRLVTLLRREQVDVIQPLQHPATLLGLAAGIIARVPVKVVGARGSTHPGRPWRSLQARLTGMADAVVPNSEANARVMINRGVKSEKVRLIHDGVAPERVRTNPAEREKLRHDLGVLDESWLIGIAAGLTAATDHGSFLQAASIVRAEVPGTRFLVVGDGPLRAELQRRSTILGLDGSVILASHPVRMAAYIGAMDVAVLPSSEDCGCPGFLLEAMALGRPIVTTGVGSNEELFRSGEAGLIVPPDNPIILAHAILELMRHPEAVEQMRERGREIFRERFTLRRMIVAHEDLYIDLWRRYEQRRTRGEAEALGES